MYVRPSQAIALLSFLGVAVGSFLPWATILVFSKAGTDGDGVITLVLAGIGGLLILLSRSTAASLFAALAALSAAAVGFYDTVDVSNRINDLNQATTVLDMHAQVGTGLILVDISAVAATIASAVHASSVRASRVVEETRWTCPECGHEIEAIATRCSSCGIALEPSRERQYHRIR